MAKLTGLLLAAGAVLALSLSSVSATTTGPLPTLAPVPLVDLAAQFKHVRLYRGEFTFDETDFNSSSQGGNVTKHEHVALTLHLTGCYPVDGGTNCQWSGIVRDATLGDAEETHCSSGTLGGQKPNNGLATLYFDFVHGTYSLNTYGLDFPCAGYSGGRTITGGFSTGHAELPLYNAPSCGTMRVVDPGASEQIDSWNFTPTLDNHVSVTTSRVSCPQISPPPAEQ